MASFAGVNFGERGQNAQTFPGWRRKAEASHTHIPGGNRVVTQKSGLLADTIALRIRCTAAQLTSLYTKVGTTDTLIFSRGTFRAFLDEIDPEEVLAGRDIFFATLNMTRK